MKRQPRRRATPPPQDSTLRAALAQGFAALLGATLESFAVPDAVFHLVHRASSDLYQRHPLDRLDWASVREGCSYVDSSSLDTGARELGLERYTFDWGPSYFATERVRWEKAPAPLKAVFAPLDESLRVARGAQVAALVRAGRATARAVKAATWFLCRRVVTDGSLFDAMRAATYTMGGRAQLVDRSAAGDLADEVEFDAQLAARLEAVTDAAVRDHLLLSCVDGETARFFGQSVVRHRPGKTTLWLAPAAHDFGPPLIEWNVGEGQANLAIFRAPREGRPQGTAA